jgi:hypothetical protein
MSNIFQALTTVIVYILNRVISMFPNANMENLAFFETSLEAVRTFMVSISWLYPTNIFLSVVYSMWVIETSIFTWRLTVKIINTLSPKRIEI